MINPFIKLENDPLSFGKINPLKIPHAVAEETKLEEDPDSNLEQQNEAGEVFDHGLGVPGLPQEITWKIDRNTTVNKEPEATKYKFDELE